MYDVCAAAGKDVFLCKFVATPKVQVSDSTSNGQISPTSAKNDSQPVVLHAQVLSMSVLMCLMIALMIAARLITWRADMCLK